VSAADLVALVCCDLGAIVRGRALPASELDEWLEFGVGWTPANQALTPLGPVAEPNPFGATGDLRLLPDPKTQVRVGGDASDSALEFVLCDIVETDGRPGEACPRHFLREALRELESEVGIRVFASFEHEFQLSDGMPSTLPFSLEAQREAQPFAGDAMAALTEAGAEPELFFAEYAERQFEIPVQPVEGVAGADRSVVLKEVVREIARRDGVRASFTPLLEPDASGNGVHIHLSLLDAAGQPALYDPAGPGYLSELGGQFAAGILQHARALTALTAPSPLSAARLSPHRWSVSAVCLANRNREALLRIPPVVSLAGADPARQMRLEYRGTDSTANPYLALGAIARAGLDGVRAGLPAPPILDRDPAQLDTAEAVRYGVGTLPRSLGESLHALEEDATARAWLTPLLYETYLSVKRAELEAVAGLDIGEVCRRYAAVY
jgi:glutamine synthetase